MSHQIVEEAAREVFETTAAMKVTEARVRGEPDATFTGLIATIALSGTRGGTLVVYCHRELVVGCAAGMLGTNGEDPGDETLEDALGELVNQIGGTIKRKLGASADQMTLSVPLVVAGRPLSHFVKSAMEPLAVDLELAEGNVCVCLWPAG